MSAAATIISEKTTRPTSFFPAKPLGCYGDGGAVFTDDDEMARLVRSLRIHGQGADKYENVRIGITGRLDTIQAAVLIEKLKIFRDEIAARDSIFKKRVAHGYFVLSAAAGLFVDPAKGPVLANYGLEHLRFIKPVYIGDTIHVRLTCKQKTLKEQRDGEDPQGIVAWDVEVFNQDAETVAAYTILTLVKR